MWKCGNVEMCFSYFLNLITPEMWKSGNVEITKCVWDAWKGVLGVIFAGYVSLASEPLRAPTPLLSILWPIIDSTLVTFGQISNFRNPNYNFLFLWIDPFLDWIKNTLLFIYSTNILEGLLTIHMKNCPTPKNPKMCDPILLTLLKIRPHYSHSRRENATQSSGTSPLASYKEVPLPPGRDN